MTVVDHTTVGPFEVAQLAGTDSAAVTDPMRLSATAEFAQPLRLYVLADHRMDMTNPAPNGRTPELTYANRLRPADLADHPILAGMVEGQRFLTRYDAEFHPEQITGDIRLTPAASDATYRAVVVEDHYVTVPSSGTVAAWAIGIVIGLILLVFLLLKLPAKRP